MKIESSVAFISLSVGIFCHISAGNFESARAIQIIKPENHSIQLELNDLKEILEADDIRDRQVVVVSIAGAMRKGKSFLLNFFIRYLYAQYKTHDVTDWLGENKSSNDLVGFKWKGGPKAETAGIWMWSDIFTHDYENGEKVAIIVLDTQGSFEKSSSMQDTSAIFALSLMLSSVQCYNIKEQIQEDSLQYLDLFTDYARAALNQTNEKPFQFLLFIVRDWSFPYENSYGLNQQIVDELMAKNAEEMPETHQLRNRIQASFKKIGAFLMPHPGMIVATSKNFTGHLQQIDTEFKQYLKVLVPLLFHPENVVIKSINGEKVRARDLLQYLQEYVDIFKGGTLPATSTLIEAMAKASNTILLNDCLNLYVHSMQNAVNNVNPYFNQSDLLDAHGMAKDGSLTKFQQARKLGGEELISVFQQRTETAIEEQFMSFKVENERKRIDYIEKANLINDKISMEIRMRFERKLLEKTDDESDIDTTELNTLFATEKQNALDEFDQRKMGDEEISNTTRAKFQEEMDTFKRVLVLTMKKYGWLTITFREATAATHATGARCDVFTPCDPYIILFIDNVKVYRTQTYWDEKYVHLGETYKSEKISKKAKITIEMWDYDSVSSHDSIQFWNTNINELLRTKTKHGYGENKIVLDSSWRDQPVI